MGGLWRGIGDWLTGNGDLSSCYDAKERGVENLKYEELRNYFEADELLLLNFVTKLEIVDLVVFQAFSP